MPIVIVNGNEAATLDNDHWGASCSALPKTLHAYPPPIDNGNNRAATASPHRRGLGPTVGGRSCAGPSGCVTPVLLQRRSRLVPHRLPFVETFSLRHHGVFRIARRSLARLEYAEPGAGRTNHQYGAGECGHQPIFPC